MAQEDTKTDKKIATEDLDKKEGRGRVADYLQAPRKKRRSFVVAALGPATSHLYPGIDSFVKAQFKNTSAAQPRSVEELVKNFSRQVVLLILDDEFTQLEEGLHIVEELKRKKGSIVIPTLFLTRKPQILINEYHKVLLAHHESDDLVDWSRTDIRYIFAKIRNGLNQKFARKSRRYKVDLPVRYYLMADDKMHQGQIMDLSLHGALLKSADNQIFKNGDQLKIYIPTLGMIPTYNQEFLRLSCRVRRVYISGTHVGVSFEYMNADLSLYLLTFITNFVVKQMPAKGKLPLIGPHGNLIS